MRLFFRYHAVTMQQHRQSACAMKGVRCVCCVFPEHKHYETILANGYARLSKYSRNQLSCCVHTHMLTHTRTILRSRNIFEALEQSNWSYQWARIFIIICHPLEKQHSLVHCVDVMTTFETIHVPYKPSYKHIHKASNNLTIAIKRVLSFPIHTLSFSLWLSHTNSQPQDLF